MKEEHEIRSFLLGPAQGMLKQDVAADLLRKVDPESYGLAALLFLEYADDRPY